METTTCASVLGRRGYAHPVPVIARQQEKDTRWHENAKVVRAVRARTTSKEIRQECRACTATQQSEDRQPLVQSGLTQYCTATPVPLLFTLDQATHSPIVGPSWCVGNFAIVLLPKLHEGWEEIFKTPTFRTQLAIQQLIYFHCNGSLSGPRVHALGCIKIQRLRLIASALTNHLVPVKQSCKVSNAMQKLLV